MGTKFESRKGEVVEAALFSGDEGALFEPELFGTKYSLVISKHEALVGGGKTIVSRVTVRRKDGAEFFMRNGNWLMDRGDGMLEGVSNEFFKREFKEVTP